MQSHAGSRQLHQLLRHEAYPEVRFHHGEYLVGGRSDYVRLVVQSVIGEIFGVELVGFCLRREGYQRVFGQRFQRHRPAEKLRKCIPACRRLPESAEILFGQRGKFHGRRGDHCEVGGAVLYCFRSLGRGVVAYPHADSRVQFAVFFQHRQQQAVQRYLAGGNEHRAVFQVAAADYLGFPRFDVLECYPQMGIQLFALGRQAHSAVASEEKRAAKLAFQVLDGSGEIRLIVQQELRRLGYAPVFCNIVEHAIIVAADVHG